MKAEGWGSITGQGIKIPQAMKHGQKKKKIFQHMPRVLHKGPVPFTPFGIRWGVTKEMDSIKAGIFSMGCC